MTTHYTILTVQIRPEIQERISIGFALFDDNQVFLNTQSINSLLRKAYYLLVLTNY